MPLVALILVYCLRPRPYCTGSDSVEVVTYVAPTPAGVRVCVPGLQIPAGTARVRLQLVSRTQERPALHMTLRLGRAHAAASSLPAVAVRTPSRISTPTFAIPELPAHPSYTAASLCLTAGDLVNWGGTPLSGAPPHPPTLQGKPFAGAARGLVPAAGGRAEQLRGARGRDPPPRLAVSPGARSARGCTC